MLFLLCATASASPNISLVLGPNTADNTPVGDFSPTGNSSFNATYSFYGDVEVDEVVQDFILRNDGDEALTIANGQVWDDVELPLTMGTCEGDVELAPDESCVFGLGVLAQAASPGNYQSRVEFLSNDPNALTWSFEGTWSKPVSDQGCSSTGSTQAPWALLGVFALLFRRREPVV